MKKIINKKTICKALGCKCSDDHVTADACCYLRLFYVIANLLAIIAIIGNAWRHW